MLNPLNKFLHFQPLPATATRRQLLLSGLGLAIAAFGSRSASAAQQEHITKSAPAPKPAGAKKLVMIDPGHGGIDSGAVGHEGSEENTSCWKSPTMCGNSSVNKVILKLN